MKRFFLLFYSIHLCTLSYSQVITFEKYYPFNCEPNSIILTDSKEYLLIGRKIKESLNDLEMLHLLKVDKSGNINWSELYSDNNMDTWGKDVVQSEDGSYIICGGRKNQDNKGDIFTAKFDTAGKVIWWKNYNLNNQAYVSSILPTSDNGFIIAGGYSIQDEYNINLYLYGLIIKLNSNGDTLWTKKYYFDKRTEFTSMVKSDDNGILIFGTRGDMDGNPFVNENFFVFKANENGDSLWTKTFNVEENYALASSIKKSKDGNFYFNGYTHSNFTGMSYGYVFKINSEGGIIWNKKNIYFPQQIVPASNNGVIYIGNNDQELIASKYAANGDNLVTNSLRFPGYPYCYASLLDEDGGYVISGSIQPLFGSNYMYLIKTNSDFSYTGIEENINSAFREFKLEQNYPNPFNPTTNINYQLPHSGEVSLKVYDILGKEVATLVNEEKPAGNYEVKFDGSDLSSGVYFYRIKAGDFSETKKFVLMK